MDLGPHASFIIASYVIAGVVIISLIGWVIADYRSQRAILQDLERSGVTRRSARQASGRA